MIGERLKKICKTNKVKQSELAELFGVNNNAISRYETTKDNPSDRNKILIAQFFDVSLDYFLGLIDEPLSISNSKKTIILPDILSNSQIETLKDFANFLAHTNHCNMAKK